MSETLAPCPFCGGEARIEQHEKGKWLAFCADVYGCGTEGWYEDTPDAAIAAWNRRTESADHAALVARVKELEAQLANTQQWAGDAVACIRHGMELMPLDQFRHWTGVAAIEQVYSQMMEDANHE